MIKTQAEYEAALARIEELKDDESVEADQELETLANEVETYERANGLA
jgi:antitoxin component HigA of HigAB toxin-antitoxin module